MTVALLWTRAEWRRRYGSLLFLTVSLGLACGVVFAVAAGAARTSSAYDRLARETRRYQASVEDAREGDENALDDIAALPGVAAADRIALFFTMVPEPELQILLVAAKNGDAFTDIDRPVILEGRRPRAGAAHEVVANEAFIAESQLRVGSTVEVVTFTPEQLRQVLEIGDPGGPPAGPRVALEIVGIGRLPVSLDRPDGQLLGTPAFTAAYGATAGNIDTILRVRLRDGDAGIEEFADAIERLPSYSFDNVFAEYGPADASRVKDATQLQATGLVIFAGVAALATLLAMGQGIARHLEVTRADIGSLTSLGLHGAARTLVAAAPIIPVVVGGVVLGAVGAVAASGLFPTGLAGRAEPDPGLRFERSVMLPSVVLALVAGIAISAGLARRLARRTSPGVKPSWLAGIVARTGLSPVATTGVRLAVDPGKGDRRLPVRTTLAGAAASVAIVGGALVFSQSLDHMVDTPRLYGWSWDATVTVGSVEATTEAAEQVAAHPGVRAVAVAADSDLEINGEQVETQALTQVKGTISPVLLEGSAPQGLDEIALGPALLEHLGASVGDRVEARTDSRSATLRISASVLFPGGEDNQGMGAWVTPELLAHLGKGGTDSHDIHIDAAPGVDLEELVDPIDGSGDVFIEEPPTTVKNIALTSSVPGQIGAFVALLGLAAVAHALVTAAQRRRHDIAVLRALGLRRGDGARIVGWHAAVLGVLAAAIGVPVGCAGGRLIWLQFASGAHLVPRAAVSPAAVLSLLLLPIAATVLVASIPALSTRRFSLAEALRTE